MKSYIYLVERKSDKIKFITYGNFKEAWNRPCSVFPFVNKNEHTENAKKTGFGLVSNVSSGRYNTKEFKVLYQYEINKSPSLKYIQWGGLTKEEKELLLKNAVPSSNGKCIVNFKNSPLSIRGYNGDKILICDNSKFIVTYERNTTKQYKIV